MQAASFGFAVPATGMRPLLHTRGGGAGPQIVLPGSNIAVLLGQLSGAYSERPISHA
jgi:hypothetical protein